MGLAGNMAGSKRTKVSRDHPDAQKARELVSKIIDAIPPEDLVEAIRRAPSLRGMILGYIAEEMFERHVLSQMTGASDIRKHDDHDRSLNKVDRDFVYNGRRYSIQLKSIQTVSIVYCHSAERLRATVQNDGSDKRTVILPTGEKISTTNYKIGDYDILAVPLFPFTGEWTFAYKRNRDCRRSTYKGYSPEVQKYLLATTEIIHFPLDEGWTLDLPELLDDTLGEAI